MIPVYSISKPFLAEAVLSLNLPLDSVIGDFISVPSVYANRTIHKLLNHTSGLADYGHLASYHAAVAASETAWTREELFDRCGVLQHNQTGFSYSNIGYLMLRMLLEAQTGLNYFESLKQRVFAPLGISGVAEWADRHPALPNYDPSWVYSGTFLAQVDSIAPAFAKLALARTAYSPSQSEIPGVDQSTAPNVRGEKATHGLHLDGRQPNGQQLGGMSAGLEMLDTTKPEYANTGFHEPGYNFGFMANGNPPTLVGHGGGGPGFGLMVLGEPGTIRFGLKYGTDVEFDQRTAIEQLRKEIAQLG